MAQSFFEMADYKAYNANHAARFETFDQFLKIHGLTHIYDHDQDSGAAFDARLSKTAFPLVMPCLTGQTNMHMVERMNWVQKKAAGLTSTLSKDLAKTRKDLANLKAATAAS